MSHLMAPVFFVANRPDESAQELAAQLDSRWELENERLGLFAEDDSDYSARAGDFGDHEVPDPMVEEGKPAAKSPKPPATRVVPTEDAPGVEQATALVAAEVEAHWDGFFSQFKMGEDGKVPPQEPAAVSPPKKRKAPPTQEAESPIPDDAITDTHVIGEHAARKRVCWFDPVPTRTTRQVGVGPQPTCVRRRDGHVDYLAWHRQTRGRGIWEPIDEHWTDDDHEWLMKVVCEGTSPEAAYLKNRREAGYASFRQWMAVYGSPAGWTCGLPEWDQEDTEMTKRRYQADAV